MEHPLQLCLEPMLQATPMLRVGRATSPSPNPCDLPAPLKGGGVHPHLTSPVEGEGVFRRLVRRGACAVGVAGATCP